MWINKVQEFVGANQKIDIFLFVWHRVRRQKNFEHNSHQNVVWCKCRTVQNRLISFVLRKQTACNNFLHFPTIASFKVTVCDVEKNSAVVVADTEVAIRRCMMWSAQLQLHFIMLLLPMNLLRLQLNAKQDTHGAQVAYLQNWPINLTRLEIHGTINVRLLGFPYHMYRAARYLKQLTISEHTSQQSGKHDFRCWIDKCRKLEQLKLRIGKSCESVQLSHKWTKLKDLELKGYFKPRFIATIDTYTHLHRLALKFKETTEFDPTVLLSIPQLRCLELTNVKCKQLDNTVSLLSCVSIHLLMLQTLVLKKTISIGTLFELASLTPNKQVAHFETSNILLSFTRGASGGFCVEDCFSLFARLFPNASSMTFGC
jgi:hypothetical protein